MMQVAIAVASAFFASIALAALPLETSTASASAPPMIVNVTTVGDVSATLAARVLAETDAIWRGGGVSFVWRRAPRVVVPYSRASETGPYVPNTLRVVIGNGVGTGGEGKRPLGWIHFTDMAQPEQEIYLSHANALALMEEARGIVGLVADMPLAQRETLLGRAMGRALAHELGHYLLASKEHTARGLMKAVLTAAELFAPDTRAFRIDPVQRRVVAARLLGEPAIASR
jgi:hypothetical protein